MVRYSSEKEKGYLKMMDKKTILAVGTGAFAGLLLSALAVKATAAKGWTLTIGIFSDEEMERPISRAYIGDTIYIGGFFSPHVGEPVVGSVVTAYVLADSTTFNLGSYTITEADVFQFNMAWYRIAWKVSNVLNGMPLAGKTVSIWTEAETTTAYRESSIRREKIQIARS
jgi:hypothetical protein